jgi:hypothetical protein
VLGDGLHRCHGHASITVTAVRHLLISCSTSHAYLTITRHAPHTHTHTHAHTHKHTNTQIHTHIHTHTLPFSSHHTPAFPLYTSSSHHTHSSLFFFYTPRQHLFSTTCTVSHVSISVFLVHGFRGFRALSSFSQLIIQPFSHCTLNFPFVFPVNQMKN